MESFRSAMLARVKGRFGALWVAAGAFVLFSLFAGDRVWKQSIEPHYVLLADALLKGQWKLSTPPEHPVLGHQMRNDWAYIHVVHCKDGRQLRGRFRGRRGGKRLFLDLQQKPHLLSHRDILRYHKEHYVSFPPLPALLMMLPMKSLEWTGFSRLRYNDSLFTLFFAALAVMMMFLLLEEFRRVGSSTRSLEENFWLTTLFGFGTVFFTIAVQGTVWFTALTVGAFCSITSLYFGVRARRPFLAGLFLGMAFLCRPPLLLVGLFFVWQLYDDAKRTDESVFSSKALRALLWFGVPVLSCMLGIFYVNVLRFGMPLQFGHLYLPGVYRRSLRYGLFGLHWFPRNFFAFFLALPELSWRAPFVRFNMHGFSIFLTTPMFLWMFFSRDKQRRDFWWLLGCAVVVCLPALFYQNTGWKTFGTRFSLDYTPLLILMLAVSSMKIDKWFVR
ncbi:MAG: hypothetical protein AAGJ35_10965, partial [Myxococcota bacterium]